MHRWRKRGNLGCGLGRLDRWDMETVLIPGAGMLSRTARSPQGVGRKAVLLEQAVLLDTQASLRWTRQHFWLPGFQTSRADEKLC